MVCHHYQLCVREVEGGVKGNTSEMKESPEVGVQKKWVQGPQFVPMLC